MSSLKLLVATTTVALTAALAGCGSHGGHDMGSMASPSSSTVASSSSSAAPATGPHNDADVMFAQMMVPHHAQAVAMSDLVLAKQGIDPEVTNVARQIRAAQAPEIERMTGWLTGWGQSATPAMDMGHHMGGMMSKADMDALDRATGDEAAERFLSGMVGHHQGAIDMADDELANGQNADAQQLARSVKSSQHSEIDTMKRLLETDRTRGRSQR